MAELPKTQKDFLLRMISKKDFESGELYDYLVNRKASTEIEDDFNTSYLDL